jgi:hypothetical protein
MLRGLRPSLAAVAALPLLSYPPCSIHLCVVPSPPPWPAQRARRLGGAPATAPHSPQVPNDYSGGESMERLGTQPGALRAPGPACSRGPAHVPFLPMARIAATDEMPCTSYATRAGSGELALPPRWARHTAAEVVRRAAARSGGIGLQWSYGPSCNFFVF